MNYIRSFLNEVNHQVILMIPGPREQKFVLNEDVLITCMNNLKLKKKESFNAGESLETLKYNQKLFGAKFDAKTFKADCYLTYFLQPKLSYTPQNIQYREDILKLWSNEEKQEKLLSLLGRLNFQEHSSIGLKKMQ